MNWPISILRGNECGEVYETGDAVFYSRPHAFARWSRSEPSEEMQLLVEAIAEVAVKE